MLVSAVSEVTQRIGLHNSRTSKALKAYAEGGPAWVGGAAPALMDGTGATCPPTAPAHQHRAALPPAAMSGPATASVPSSSSMGLRGVMNSFFSGSNSASYVAAAGSQPATGAAEVVETDEASQSSTAATVALFDVTVPAASDVVSATASKGRAVAAGAGLRSLA
jgi:hypothetical protein